MRLDKLQKQYDDNQILIAMFLNANSFLDLVKVYITLKKVREERIPFHLKVMAIWLPYALIMDMLILSGLVFVLFNL
tara:strand:- start:968 stop:1198 length:231 start_codon:yes stop_codon:yes gene_type:complete